MKRQNDGTWILNDEEMFEIQYLLSLADTLHNVIDVSSINPNFKTSLKEETTQAEELAEKIFNILDKESDYFNK